MDTLVFCNHCQKLNRVPNEKAFSDQAICGNCKTNLSFHDGVQESSDAGLKKIIQNSTTPIIVDFWAEWCAPCRAFAPTFKTAAKELIGKISFVKINTEENPVSSSLYQIRSIPTLMIFKDGKEVERQSGALPLASLKILLSKHL